MNIASYVATLITIIGILVALTNIIVEVVKQITWNKISTNVVAIIVSIGWAGDVDDRAARMPGQALLPSGASVGARTDRPP